ncbi:uncharacterized protein LOC124949770 isoform X1 [Vespa velutina]|uniref:uncharacterized protein LOC124949770 isoform X1 n=3 Tax=Vespa velutina TaxID=202808 RepID=UPI001FB4B2BF|nr:uncharacterized protein LOC124949770 isoform X1 [Vespa velutina]XP_047351414.1 uncharacterized protein LOC124949770 isoform X1 [Vespa velutina]
MTLKLITGINLVLIAFILPQHVYSNKQSKFRQLKPGCRYDGRRYEDGTMVNTTEPCLQCRCIEGALRCRLRVCPRLPNSPPPGCHIRQPEENVCCAELICGGPRDMGNTLRRANTETSEETSLDEGCLHEGVRYGPGSAMKGSRRCEYCYCISGARRCIRPKCLLPLPGCIPLYTPHSCCPVAYNCTHSRASTSAPPFANGCRVGDRDYGEGEMVREIDWKTPCDNCFCAMGTVRCVPLACAPPLQGCSPIVRNGQCCPSTYNCSGSIEVKATQNYASYAFISKDYAKFRKETNFFPVIDRTTIPSVEGRGHRIVDERIDGRTIIVDGESSVTDDSTSWPSTFPTEIMDNEILIETVPYTKSIFEPSVSTTSNDEITTNTVRTIPDSISLNRDLNGTTEFSKIYSTSAITETSFVIANDLQSTEEMTTTTTSSSSMLESTTLPIDNFSSNVSKNYDLNSTRNEDKVDRRDERESSTTEINDELSTKLEITTILENEEITTGNIDKGPVSGSSSTILMPDDILAVNVTVKTNVSVGHIQGVTINPIRSIPPDVEAILNITHREKGEDYSEYDYSAPTLPPSLPNVRIIPFVAADALVKDKDVPSAVTGYPSGSVVVPPELRPTDTSGFYDIATQENGFSPPIETEGGFVPREPPYFDSSYHSTDLNLEIGTGVTVVPAQITGPHRKNGDLASNCLFESHEYRHGEILPSTGICIICMCYYGNVVCSGEKCPPLKIGCQRLNTAEGCCGKITCVNAEESPTVVLDRVDSTAPSQRQPIVSPDPFRDVIKTEPAPDLPSLMEDMIPYLVEHGITTPRPTTTPMTTDTILRNQGGSSQHIHKHTSNFDYMDKLPLIHSPYDYVQEIDISLQPPKNLQNFNDTPQNKYPSSLIYKIIDPNVSNVYKHDQSSGLPNIITHTDNNTFFNISDILKGNTNQWNNSITEIQKSNGNKNGTTMIVESTIRTPTSTTKILESEKDNIFSLDNVLELLFTSDDFSYNEQFNETTKAPVINSTSDSANATTITTTINGTTIITNSITASTSTTVISPTKKMSSTQTEGFSLKDQEIRNQDVGFSFTKTSSPTTLSSTKFVDITTTKYGNTDEVSSKILDNEIPVSVSGLLKLAGCNIYGRMYRVGRIITELSSPCLECRCTEIGVQCKQLEC